MPPWVLASGPKPYGGKNVPSHEIKQKPKADIVARLSN